MMLSPTLRASTMETIEKVKQSLIETNEWYRDDYNCGNTNIAEVYNDIIENIKLINDFNKLEIYEKIVDDWIDY